MEANGNVETYKCSKNVEPLALHPMKTQSQEFDGPHARHDKQTLV